MVFGSPRDRPEAAQHYRDLRNWTVALQSMCPACRAILRLATLAGVTQLVECQPSKLNVASSSLVSRSISSFPGPVVPWSWWSLR